MSALLTPLLLAFSMLTRLPLHPRSDVSEVELRWSVVFYPWVGLVLGGVLVACAPLLRGLPDPMLGGVFAVALLALLTGGLHLDGLADWFDALGGGRGDRTRMLEIMKDPRIGAHGAVALCLALLAKTVAFAHALSTLHGWSLALIPLLSRLAIVPLVAWMKPARDQGLARSVSGQHALWITLGALLPSVGLIALLRLDALIASLLGALVVALLVGLWAQRRLGGATGDVYGAALELAELAALIVAISATH